MNSPSAMNFKSMDWTGVLYTPTLLVSSTPIIIQGALKLVSGMSTTIGGITLSGSSGSANIDLAGKSVGIFTVSGNGATKVMQSSITATTRVIHTAGTFDLNGYSVTTAEFTSNGTTTRTLTLGASQISCSGNIILTSTGLTLNCGTSKITHTGTGFATFGLTFWDLDCNPSLGTYTLTGTIPATFHEITLHAGKKYILPHNNTTNVTSLVGDGSFLSPITVRSSSYGTAATISTTATISIGSIQAIDLTGSGSGSITMDSSDDVANNTNINFTNPINLHNRYWVGNSGDIFDITHWAMSSGGVGGAPLPDHYNNVYFDANSFTTTGRVVSVGAGGFRCCSMDWTGALYTPTFSSSGFNSIGITGNLKYINSMSASSVGVVVGVSDSGTAVVGNSVITTFSGKQLYSLSMSGDDGDTIDLANDLWVTGYLTLIGGTFDTRGYNVRCAELSINDANYHPVINLNNSVISCIPSSQNEAVLIENTNGNVTLNAGTSKFYLTTANKAFKGGGMTFYDLEWAGGTGASKNLSITGSNTFHNIYLTGASNTGLSFISGTTTTINDLPSDGTAGLLRQLIAGTSGSAFNLNILQPTIEVNYYTIKDCYCNTANFYAINSTDATGNTNVFFYQTPTGNKYWVGNGGSWQDPAHWAAYSGGLGGQPAPTSTDAVIFDANSFTLTGQEVTTLANAQVKTLDFSAVTNNPKIYNYFNIYGTYVAFSPNMEVDAGSRLYFTPDINAYVAVATGGLFFDYISIVAPDPNQDFVTLALQDSINCRAFQCFVGTRFLSNNRPITATEIVDFQGAAYANLGLSEIHTPSFNATSYQPPYPPLVFYYAGDLYAQTLDMRYPAVDHVFQLGNVFLGAIGGAAAIVRARFKCNNLTLYKDNSYSMQSVSSGNDYEFISDAGMEFANLSQDAVQDHTIILFSPFTGESHYFKNTSGIISVDWWQLSYSDAIGGATFYAGDNSIDLGGNTGWIFTDPPTGGGGCTIYWGAIPITKAFFGAIELVSAFFGDLVLCSGTAEWDGTYPVALRAVVPFVTGSAIDPIEYDVLYEAVVGIADGEVVLPTEYAIVYEAVVPTFVREIT